MDDKALTQMTYRDFGGDLSVLAGESVLITGGTGSFAQRFARAVLRNGTPRRLAIYSRDEMKQYEMEQSLAAEGFDLERLRFFIGDVRDEPRLEMALRDVDTVIHAAALKHVPAAEYNPFECIHTNVLGAENVVRTAIRSGVQRVIALSTDKASAPINLYGASKLASDKIFVAANSLSGPARTRFSVVRYGNVMGSRGSVVPLFRRLAEQNARELPITDARMTRFWISLDQGVNFVLSCLKAMQGGELFVPKIPSIRIVDLAEAMAPGLPHKVIGIRPGEKLHESMITEDESRSCLELPDRYILLPPVFPFSQEDRFAVHGSNYAEEFFHYSSDTNREWLTVGAIRDWLERI